MRPMLVVAAGLAAVGGLVPAVLWLVAAAAVYAARRPERLLDVACVASFCGLGYLVG